MNKKEIIEVLKELPKLPDGNCRISVGFLKKYKKEVIFVFGDNLDRRGLGGQAAIARKVTNSYGFVTKKYPTHSPSDYYKPSEYSNKFISEIKKLKKEIEKNNDIIYLVPTLGNGLANKFNIWENVIRNNIKIELEGYNNVVFLY